MNYKETLFFVAKCLTISLEEKNRNEIEEQLKNTTINWESVVKLSTEHYVFPALYCNLKKANFLQYLPSDLVEYMKHITDLNRERNEQIILQAKEINALLLQNNITPIFLKGTGNLLEGLYDDIAERMVGDIDFIVSKNEYFQTIKEFRLNGFDKVTEVDYSFPQFKHYDRLKKDNKIAAVEIHKELLIEKYVNEFNYDVVKNTVQNSNGAHVMSFDNQLSLSIIAKQINDDGFHYNTIALRNAYDVFLLSQKTTAKNAFKGFETLKEPLNCFLAICYTAFGKIDSLSYNKTTESEKYISVFLNNLENPLKSKKTEKNTRTKLFIQKRLSIIKKSFLDKEHRSWLLKRISDKNWQREKLIQLGLKNPKPNS